MTAKKNKKDSAMSKLNGNNCLCNNVRDSMEAYFDDLDGQETSNLYDLFMSEVEKPLFEVVMHNSNGNITKAAHILGLNRATLRNRLKKYGLD
jgi:Fis family transcriptional regulator